jgi:AcrR family transcriptional regulator
VGPSLIEVTVELVADRGFAGVALSGIAEHAGITKAAVLYHFPSKIAVVRAAHDHVLSASGGHVAAVEAEEAPAAYVRAVIGYLRDHPRHTRMITEALTHDDEGTSQPTGGARRRRSSTPRGGHAAHARSWTRGRSRSSAAARRDRRRTARRSGLRHGPATEQSVALLDTAPAP